LKVDIVLAGNVKHQVLFLLAKEFSWGIFHDHSCIQLAECAFLFKFRFLEEGLIFEIFDDEFHADLLLRVSKLVEKEGRLETESLPAILREPIDLPFSISDNKVIFQTGILRGGLHEGMGFIQPANEAHKG
jgi:hypothetical protein